MTGRPLTQDEQDVLNHVVVDATAWWENVNARSDIFPAPETVLAAKVSRWRPNYLQARAREGLTYKPAAQTRTVVNG